MTTCSSKDILYEGVQGKRVSITHLFRDHLWYESCVRRSVHLYENIVHCILIAQLCISGYTSESILVVLSEIECNLTVFLIVST